MGGHGALICALKNPGKYLSVSAFAPICNPVNCPWGKKAFSGYLGDNEEDWKVEAHSHKAQPITLQETNIPTNPCQSYSRSHTLAKSLANHIFDLKHSLKSLANHILDHMHHEYCKRYL